MATRRLVTVLVLKHMRAKLTPTNLMHLNFFFFLLDQMHIFFLFNLEKKKFLKNIKKNILFMKVLASKQY